MSKGKGMEEVRRAMERVVKVGWCIFAPSQVKVARRDERFKMLPHGIGVVAAKSSSSQQMIAGLCQATRSVAKRSGQRFLKHSVNTTIPIRDGIPAWTALMALFLPFPSSLLAVEVGSNFPSGGFRHRLRRVCTVPVQAASIAGVEDVPKPNPTPRRFAGSQDLAAYFPHGRSDSSVPPWGYPPPPRATGGCTVHRSC
nr:hypothetical protein Iba_chr13eCG10820 [Ipomoea batatas]